jgi:hypothetical protein
VFGKKLQLNDGKYSLSVFRTCSPVLSFESRNLNNKFKMEMRFTAESDKKKF